MFKSLDLYSANQTSSRPARSRNKKELLHICTLSVRFKWWDMLVRWEDDRLIERSNVWKWSRFSDMYVAVKFLFLLIFVFPLFEIH